MNLTNVDQIVNAVLYQDHILYPYRSSARKGRRQPFTPGRLYPDYYCVAQNGTELCMMQTECLLRCHTDYPILNVRVRFLHPAWREIQMHAPMHGPLSVVTEREYRVVPEIVVGGKLYQTWQEALEREVTISPISLHDGDRLTVVHGFRISAWGEVEPIGNVEKENRAILVRRQEALEGSVEIAASPLSARCFRISVRVRNETPVPSNDFANRDAVSMRTFAATHAILNTEGAEFISMTNPPADSAPFINSCENIGAWPVLIDGEENRQRDTMLASSVLLPDYPQVSPESRADALNADELDEAIELREMSIAAAEKREIGEDNSSDCRCGTIRSLLPHQIQKISGARRDWAAAEDFFVHPKPVASAVRNGVEIKAGDRVRIAPPNHSDVLDLMLAGRIVTVESLEQDAEQRIQLSVALLDKPGHDTSLLRQSEHRFMYGLDEIEPLTNSLV
jgi:hydrogenase maturation protease